MSEPLYHTIGVFTAETSLDPTGPYGQYSTAFSVVGLNEPFYTVNSPNLSSALKRHAQAIEVMEQSRIPVKLNPISTESINAAVEWFGSHYWRGLASEATGPSFTAVLWLHKEWLNDLYLDYVNLDYVNLGSFKSMDEVMEAAQETLEESERDHAHLDVVSILTQSRERHDLKRPGMEDSKFLAHPLVTTFRS